MQRVANSDCPIELYKFKELDGSGIDYVEDILRNNRVKFSSPSEFSDPFDCRCIYDIRNSRNEVVLRKAMRFVKEGKTMDDSLAEAEQEIPNSPEEISAWQERQIVEHNKRLANTGIFCLTPQCDDQLMWTHYAKCHTGACIQFRVRNVDEASQLDFIGEAQLVEYVKRCPMINFVQDETGDIVNKVFLTKTLPYSYEKEWRIVRYNDGPGLKPIPKGIIGAVILGVNIKEGNRDRVIRACADYEGDVEIVSASLAPHTYGLEFGLEMTV
jgi:hypothetical protein